LLRRWRRHLHQLHGKGDDKYDIVRVGINGRLDTLQAAILLEKLAIFPDEIEARQRVAERYNRGLEGIVPTPRIPQAASSVWAQYTITVPTAKRDPLMAALGKIGIPTAVYYPRALHEQTAYRHCPVSAGGVETATRLPREVLSLPMHPYLSEADQDRVIAGIKQILPGL
jgi:dTDP-4-amino-4,6-dideoxygalactose transaminase